MKRFLLVLLLLFTIQIHCEIFEIQHFQEIYSFLTPDTLIILDIDDTLLNTKQMLGSDEWFKLRICQHQKNGLTSHESFEKTISEWEAIRHLTQMELVEPGIDKIIQDLQNEGFLVMCLTTQGLALATCTWRQLLEAQIDLTHTPPCRDDCYFKVDGHGNLYRAGILFTSGCHKGHSLFGLLDIIGYTPQRILFVNDKKSHLIPVEEIARDRGIDFIGLRYGFSDARKAAFCEEIANYQFMYSTFSRLITDEEAKYQLMQIE